MTKIIAFEFANSVDPEMVANYEPPHQDLYCLPSSQYILNTISPFYYNSRILYNVILIYTKWLFFVLNCILSNNESSLK